MTVEVRNVAGLEPLAWSIFCSFNTHPLSTSVCDPTSSTLSGQTLFGLYRPLVPSNPKVKSVILYLLRPTAEVSLLCFNYPPDISTIELQK